MPSNTASKLLNHTTKRPAFKCGAAPHTGPAKVAQQKKPVKQPREIKAPASLPSTVKALAALRAAIASTPSKINAGSAPGPAMEMKKTSAGPAALPPKEKKPALSKKSLLATRPALESKPSDLSHLNSLSIQEEKGPINFGELSKRIQTNKPYRIPLKWPTPRKQFGPCCGLYALETALKYAYPHANVPPARKNGNPLHKTSIRRIAKLNEFTSFGAIFDADYLRRTAAIAGFPACKSRKLNSFGAKAYTEDLCHIIDEGSSAIVSCDMQGSAGIPGKSQGLRTHWALVFGYLHMNDECYFLVTQFNKFYLWPASKLYESNFGLPIDNPRAGSKYLYYKTKTTEQGKRVKKEHFVAASAGLSSEILKRARHCKETSLLPFRFTAATTPTPSLKHCIKLKTPAPSQGISLSL